MNSIRFFFEDEEVSFEFPPIGNEWLTDHYNGSTGIDTPDQGILACNPVANILYAAREIPEGNEFVMFKIHTRVRDLYVLWTDTTIEIVPSDGIAWGISSGLYLHLLNSTIKRYPERYKTTYVPYYYLNHGFLEHVEHNQTRMISVIMNGVEYRSPRYRQVVLTNVAGSMVDSNGVQYIVDHVSEGNALYALGHVFRYLGQARRKPDSTTIIDVMKRNVILIDEFWKAFKIPRGDLEKHLSQVEVILVSDRAEFLAIDNSKKKPFFSRSHTGGTRNATVLKTLEAGSRLRFDQARMLPSDTDHFFINNQRIIKKNKNPFVVAQRIKNVLFLSCYSNRPEKDEEFVLADVATKIGPYKTTILRGSRIRVYTLCYKDKKSDGFFLPRASMLIVNSANHSLFRSVDDVMKAKIKFK